MENGDSPSQERKSPTVGMYDRPERKASPLMIVLFVVLALIALGALLFFML
jgi:hypothetical protein